MAKYSPEQRPKKTPKKADPWTKPPNCKAGDATEDAVYTAVGNALTNWGHIEHELGEIFLALIGSERRSYEAMMAFSSIMSGRGRSDMIVAAARAYFLRRTDTQHQETKRQLADLMAAVAGFADRRNEIAHGVVRMWLGLEIEENEGGFRASFVLSPSFFSAKKRGMQVMENGFVATPPTYEYSSKEINSLAHKFQRLAHPAAAIGRQICRQRHLERQALLQKSSEQ